MNSSFHSRLEALDELAKVLNVDTKWLAKVLTSILAPHGPKDWEDDPEIKYILPVCSQYIIGKL